MYQIKRLIGTALTFVPLVSSAAGGALPSGACNQTSGECAWLLDWDLELGPLRRETERLEAIVSGEEVVREYPRLVPAALNSCENVDGKRDCIKDALAVTIAKTRAQIPAKNRGKGLSDGPMSLECDAYGTRRMTWVGKSLVVLSLSEGYFALHELARASGVKYGAWTPKGEISLWNKGEEYTLSLPDGGGATCWAK